MISEQLAYLGYASGWRAVRFMPAGVAYPMFDQVADDQWRRRTKGVRQLERNLGRVLGPDISPEELREVSRAGMRSYFRYWCDAFRLPSWSTAQVLDFTFEDEHRMIDILASGRGVVAGLPHMGNWDHVGAYASLKISPVTAVAEVLRPERLYRAFVDLRESLGLTILGLGDPAVFPRLTEICGNGGLVGLVCDRDLSAKGIDVQFFGATARFPAGPAALAVDAGAALLPVSLFRGDGRNAGRVLPEVVPPDDGDRRERIVRTTQALATALEAQIAEHPQDWHMLQKVWLADLDPQRLEANAGDAAGPQP